MITYRLFVVAVSGLVPTTASAEATAAAADISFWQILISAAVGYYIYRKLRPRTKRPAPADNRLIAWQRRTKVLWSGGPLEIEFTYHDFARRDEARRHVGVTSILRDPERNRIYLQGICRDSNEERTFSLDAITTKILDHGRRYDTDDWIEKITGTYPF